MLDSPEKVLGLDFLNIVGRPLCHVWLGYVRVSLYSHLDLQANMGEGGAEFFVSRGNFLLLGDTLLRTCMRGWGPQPVLIWWGLLGGIFFPKTGIQKTFFTHAVSTFLSLMAFWWIFFLWKGYREKLQKRNEWVFNMTLFHAWGVWFWGGAWVIPHYPSPLAHVCLQLTSRFPLFSCYFCSFTPVYSAA